jgi:hypothetical protein
MMASAKRPDMWKSGAEQSMAGGGPGGRPPSLFRSLQSISRAPWNDAVLMKQTTLRWVMTAPLGRPVVPLV